MTGLKGSNKYLVNYIKSTFNQPVIKNLNTKMFTKYKLYLQYRNRYSQYYESKIITFY